MPLGQGVQDMTLTLDGPQLPAPSASVHARQRLGDDPTAGWCGKGAAKYGRPQCRCEWERRGARGRSAYGDLRGLVDARDVDVQPFTGTSGFGQDDAAQRWLAASRFISVDTHPTCSITAHRGAVHASRSAPFEAFGLVSCLATPTHS